MRRDRMQSTQRGARKADHVMFDRQDRFRHDVQIAFEQQIVDSHDGAGEGILHWCEQHIGCSVVYRLECRVERWPWHRDDVFAEELDRSGFAESAVLTLKRNA